jgi:hypothetical protein
MMEIELKRRHGTKGYTHGQLFIDGKYFCDTLEDEERDVKIDGITAIRSGRYSVDVTLSVRFKRRLPLLKNVANFTGVRIHSGNTAKDTEGCILVGEYAAEGYVKNSRIVFNRLFSEIDSTIKRGESVVITVL